MTTQIYTLQVLRERYAQSLDWLRGLDVRVGNGRLSNYLRIIDRAIEAEAKGDTQHQSTTDFASMLVEVSDIIDIASLDPALFASGEVRRKLHFVASGPDVFTDSGDDRARDYAFEFSTAAVLGREGAFGAFAERTGDLLTREGQHVIECKRVSSLKKIEQRLRDGRDQIKRSADEGGPTGLVALDLTTPIRLAHGPIAASSEDEIAVRSEEQVRAYIGEHIVRPDIFDAIHRPFVLGVMVRFMAVGTAGDAGNIRRSVVWSALELHDSASAEGALFLRLAGPFGKGPLVNITREEIESARAAIDTSIRPKQIGNKP